MNITPQQAHTILTGMTDVVMKNHDLENAEIEEISHFALAYILAEVESLDQSDDQPYAYDVPTDDGTELAYAIYFTKYNNPLPEGAIPLYLKSQAQEHESKWISVDERLPEGYKPVLVVTNFGDVYTCRLPVIIAKNSKEGLSVGRRERFTHWMPLPPAPEGGDK